MTRSISLLALGTLFLAGACSTRKNSPEFERKWAQAKKSSGLKEVQVIDTRSRSDLKGNVQRLGDFQPPPSDTHTQKRPITLSQNQVGRHIRRQISRLTSCHRASQGRSGKALLTVRIQPSGLVAAVTVSAPSFSGTRLAGCLQEGAMRWRFPRFRKGPLTYTYPLIFR